MELRQLEDQVLLLKVTNKNLEKENTIAVIGLKAHGFSAVLSGPSKEKCLLLPLKSVMVQRLSC